MKHQKENTMKLLEDIVLSEITFFTPLSLWYVAYEHRTKFILYDCIRLGFLYLGLLIATQTLVSDAHQRYVGKVKLGWILTIIFVALSLLVYRYEYVKARYMWNTGVTKDREKRIRRVWYLTQLISPTRFVFPFNTSSMIVNVAWIFVVGVLVTVVTLGIYDYEVWEKHWSCYPSSMSYRDYRYGYCPSALPLRSGGKANEHACTQLYPEGSSPSTCDRNRYVYMEDNVLELLVDSHSPAFIHITAWLLGAMYVFHVITLPASYVRSVGLTAYAEIKSEKKNGVDPITIHQFLS